MLRKLFLPTALTAAIGGPYLLSEANKTDWSKLVNSVELPSFTASKESSEEGDPLLKEVLGNGNDGAETTTPEGLPDPTPQAAPVDLAEVLSFGVTPNWVMATWPRLSARLGTLELQGYRVPYYSGDRRDDVAGALTYYFDQHQVLKRITFLGRTGDATKIVAVASGLHGLERHPTTQPLLTLYQAMENGRPRGQLWIRPARVVQGDNASQTFEIRLTVDRPSEKPKKGLPF
jgi:hypothetical protein